MESTPLFESRQGMFVCRFLTIVLGYRWHQALCVGSQVSSCWCSAEGSPCVLWWTSLLVCGLAPCCPGCSGCISICEGFWTTQYERIRLVGIRLGVAETYQKKIHEMGESGYVGPRVATGSGSTFAVVYLSNRAGPLEVLVYRHKW